MQHSPARALSGIRVIELASWIPGPYCGRLFAGLGAEVIKVEPPCTGDASRRHGPFPGDRPHPETSGLYLYLNTAKRSITLDWRTASGRDLLRRLLQDADVVIEDAGPAAMAELGLDDASRRREFPRLALVSISDMGSFGPYRDYESTEGAVLALSGMLSITGDPAREPLMNGGYLASYGCGQAAFVAALAAVYAGGSEHVETSVLDHAMTLVEVAPQMSANDGVLRRRNGNAGAPGWGLHPCADGWVAIAFASREDLNKFADVFDAPGLKDPKFDDFAWGFVKETDEFTAHLLGALLPRTGREIYELAQANRLPFGYVSFPEEMLADEQLRDREFFPEIEHPLAGRQAYAGPPFRMGDSPWRAERAPLLGEHNELVYTSLGLDAADLARLRAAKVI